MLLTPKYCYSLRRVWRIFFSTISSSGRDRGRLCWIIQPPSQCWRYSISASVFVFVSWDRPGSAHQEDLPNQEEAQYRKYCLIPSFCYNWCNNDQYWEILKYCQICICNTPKWGSYWLHQIFFNLMNWKQKLIQNVWTLHNLKKALDSLSFNQ